MQIRLLSILLAFSLLACKSSEQLSTNSPAKKELSEKEAITFGRIYIEAAKEKVLGNIDKAAELYQEAIKIDPTSPAAHYELGLVYNSLGDQQNAFEEFKIANQLDPKNYWYKLSYATFLESQGSIEESIRLFKELAKENPDQLEIKYELAKLLLNQGKIEEGVDYLNQIETEIGISEEISFLKQRIYLSVNNVEKAAAEVEALIENFPSQLEYYNSLANIYLQNGKEEEAKGVLNRLEQKDISDANVQFSLAKIYLDLGDMEKYQQYIFPAFGSPDLNIDEKVKFVLANYQIAADQSEELAIAVKLAEAMTKAHPENAKSHALYADFLYFSERDEEAIEAYRKTISIDSSRFPVWNQLLLILSENSKNQLLLNYSERAVNLFPNQATLYLIYGLALSTEKEYEKAVDYLEMGKDLVIENQALKGQFYSSLGDMYHELGDFESSDRSYEQSLRLDPNNIYVLNNYSYYLSLRKEKLDRAKEMSLKSNQIAPGQASFQDTYAWILYQLGEYDEALVWINKAIGSDPNVSAVLLEHKGDILFKLGNSTEAVEYWKKAKDKGEASDLIDRKIEEKQLYE